MNEFRPISNAPVSTRLRNDFDNDLSVLRKAVTVVIPTLNEAASIGHLLNEASSQCYDRILVVDGHSEDDTAKIAMEHGAAVIQQNGVGKAGALVTAIRAVSTPYIIVMDGDGSYDPSDLDKFTSLIGQCDYVNGIRKRDSISRLHRIGNSILNSTFNLLFGTSIRDICSGMYLLSTRQARKLVFEKHPLTAEQEIAAQMALSSVRISSVSINYRKRFGGKSKTNTWRQGFRDLRTNFDLARMYNPVLLFSAIAVLALIPAFAILGYVALLNYVFHHFRSGLALLGAMLLIVAGQGLTVATLSFQIRTNQREFRALERELHESTRGRIVDEYSDLGREAENAV